LCTNLKLSQAILKVPEACRLRLSVSFTKNKLAMKFVFLLIAAGLVNSSSCAQATVSARLDSFFQSLWANGMINGNVLIAEKGKILYRKSFGIANVEHETPNIDSSEFTLGSVSKTLTSIAVLQLRDQEKLKLDDPLAKYFPEFPYPEITIRHLLSHTSGLPDYELYKEEMDKTPDKIFTIHDILPSLKKWKEPLHFRPGEKWQYVNTNFCLLALLVEKLSGLTFQKYIEKYIFAPSEMSNTYFQSDPLKTANSNGTINYEYPWLFSTNMQPADSIKRNHWRSFNASGFVGQGNIMTTTGDLLKFDEALYSEKVLKAITLTEAFTPTRLNNGQIVNTGNTINKSSYGLGWFISDDTAVGKIVWHSGGVPGGLSMFIRNISRKQTVIVFDNMFNKWLYGYGWNAMNILNDKPLVNYKKSLTHEYNMVLLKKGSDAAFCELIQLKADTLHYYISEDDMNELGLQLLYAATFPDHREMALEVLKLNILLFPTSFNTYDSYGEALADSGKKEEAILMYQKSIELNSRNEGGKRALEQLKQK
jgi:CubicO group peptidase (beta-lactamase class C family)